MSQEFASAIMIALAVAFLGLAAWGWVNRRNRFRYLEEHLNGNIPDSHPIDSFDAFHVATTLAEKPLERVPVGPLSFRSKAHCVIYAEGLLIASRGEKTVFLSAKKGLRAGLATWTIDRVVEPDGLIFVRWGLGPEELDTYLRVVDRDCSELIKLIEIRGRRRQ